MALAIRAKAGDVAARNAVVMNIYDLIRRQANIVAEQKFADADELVQVGMLKAVEAFDTFDPSRGYRLCTYMMRGIVQQMVKHAEEGVIRVPPNTAVLLEQTEQLKANARRLVPLDWRSPVTGLPVDVSSGEMGAEDKFVRREQVEMAHAAMRCLDKRERAIVAMRIDGVTFQEIGRSFRLSKERVRQIEVAAKAKLREILEGRR